MILIEDTCESIGSKFNKKYLGTFGDFSSFSFYSSHQISSGEGGMICCKNKEDYNIILSLRSMVGQEERLLKVKFIKKIKILIRNLFFLILGII